MLAGGTETSMPRSALPSESYSASRSLFNRLRQDPVFVVTALLLVGILLVGAIGPSVLPLDPNKSDPSQRFVGAFKDFHHPFGTDHIGRDLLARTIWGARSSLIVGLAPVALGSGAGIFVGLLAGYAGGAADQVLMRLIDALLAIPGILLAVAAVVALGTGLFDTVIVLSIFFLPGAARLARGATLTTAEKTYVEAARSVGASPIRVAVNHILPNILAPMVVYGTLGVANMILLSAGLSFLGMGAQPPAVDWGAMIAEGHSYIRLAPQVVYVPGLAIFTVALLVNLMGDSLQDAMDPKSVTG